MRSAEAIRATVGLGLILGLAACTGAQPSVPPQSATQEADAKPSLTATPVPSCAEPVTGTPPPARGYAAMVSLTPELGLLLVGGETAPPPEGGEVLTDTWTLAQASDWTNRTRCPSPPWGAAAYDAESERVILFGGVVEGWTDVHEVWAFDPATNEWTRLALDGGPDEFGWVAYDAESDRVIMFGQRAETWAYDFNANAWQEMTPPSSPPGRIEFALAYDPGSDQVILFGGYRDVAVGDTWAYDYNRDSWTDLAPAIAPAPRAYPAMVHDPGTDAMILFGGESRGGRALGDTWAFDVDAGTWTDLAPASSPGPIDRHAMAYDPTTGLVVLFGGGPIAGQFQDDTWLYDSANNTWAQLP